MPANVELARQQWEEGYRRLQSRSGDESGYRELLGQVDVLHEELRRRVGGRFELRRLAEVYEGAERWASDAIETRAPGREWPRSVTVATDAAFHLFARAARDYEP